MFNIIPIGLILICLCVIIAVIIRKFPVLANLDIDTMQTEKEAKFKERIISNRMKRGAIKWKSRLVGIFGPAGKGLSDYLGKLYSKLQSLKEIETRREEARVEDIPVKIDSLFAEADNFVKNEEWGLAENKYIEIISLDAKNYKAFKMLGRVLMDKKNFEEAIQTFAHALKLQEDYHSDLPEQAADPVDRSMAESREAAVDPDHERASLLYNMALAHKAGENYEQCSLSLKKALRLEPKNPRYLDTMIEVSIINKDKVPALDAYEKLTEANPDNNKLAEFKMQIDEL